MIKAIIDFFGVVLEAVIISSFFNMFATPKVAKKWLLLAYSAYIVVATVCCVIFKQEIILFLRILVAVFALSFLYNCSMLKKILYSIVIMVLLLLAEIFIGLILSAITGQEVQNLIDNPFYYMQGVVISKSILVVIIKASGHYIKPKSVQLSKPTIVVSLFLSLATFFLVYVMSDYAKQLKDKNMVLMVVAIFGLVVANLSLMYLFEWQLKREEKHNTELQERQQMEMQIKYFEEVLDTRKEYDKVIHDFKNQLFAVQDAIVKSKAEGLEKIKDLCNFVVDTTKLKYTQNDALNALIHSKMPIVNKNGIAFSCKSFMAKNNAVSDLDMCIIVGNLLDNAIEACQRIQAESRYIDMQIKQQEEYLYIEIKNGFDTTLGVDIKESHKKDKHMHGFGIANVKDVVENYNGFFNLENKEEEVIVSVILHNIIY